MTHRIAFYLPQFHTIPENDEWWGAGFTEWVNVARATPLFEGHEHPKKVGSLGAYDLTDITVLQAQSQLARRYGLSAFCQYFYWFDGYRLLERPTDLWRENPDLLPYCLSWANESWTRRWDGKNSEVLMPQTYVEGYEDRLFDDLLPHLLAPHYFRVDDKPILVVHRPDLLPNPRASFDRIRDRAKTAGLKGLYLVGAETTVGLNPRTLGLDALAEFPPVGANTLRNAYTKPLRGVDARFAGRLLSYDKLISTFAERSVPSFKRHRGVCPGWDNTARRGVKATIYVGQEPHKFSDWLNRAEALEREANGDNGIVFINAWNEWAEGAYLEPDGDYGSAYLRTLHKDSNEASNSFNGQPTSHQNLYGFGQMRSLAYLAGASLLGVVRRLRARWRSWNA